MSVDFGDYEIKYGNSKYAERARIARTKPDTPARIATRARHDAIRENNRKAIEAEKSRRGCCEFCKEIFHPQVYQWHHINDDDPSNRSLPPLVARASVGRVLQELDKCVMICPTCHVIFHSELCCMFEHKQQHIDGTFNQVNALIVEEEETVQGVLEFEDDEPDPLLDELKERIEEGPIIFTPDEDWEDKLNET